MTMHQRFSSRRPTAHRAAFIACPPRGGIDIPNVGLPQPPGGEAYGCG